MIFYYGRRHDSASVGTRRVAVTCEKCGMAYFYDLTRVGNGSATAHYGLGNERAARSAADRAKKDLGRRLAADAELVPCPKCLWINEDLVTAYRRSRHRGWTMPAVVAGIGGSAVSLLIAWSFSNGPGADREVVPYFLIGGPALSIGLAASIVGWREALRRMVRPNRDHPFPPRLPHGTPAPLTRDPITGELGPSGPVADPDDLSEAWVDFRVGRSRLPDLCCGCLAPSDPRAAQRRPLHPALTLDLPLCLPCSRRWARQKWLGALLALALVGAIGLPTLVALKVDEILFWMAVAGLGAVAPVVGAMVAGHRSAPARVKVVDAARGVVQLRFRNEKFAGLMVARG